MATELKIPRELADVRATPVEVAKTVEKARVDVDEYGICPICGDNMKESTDNGVPVIVCLKDRHVAPRRNQG